MNSFNQQRLDRARTFASRQDDVELHDLLCLVCREGDLRTLRSVLSECTSKVDTRNSDGDTLLMFAASLESIPVVEALMDFGAAVDASNAIGQTAVMVASRCGSLDILRLLHARGSDLQRVDHMKRNALHWAMAGGDYPDACAFLLEKGVDPDQKTAQGFTPTDYAKTLQRQAALNLLQMGRLR